MKNIVHLKVGIQGSGKSTFATKLAKELNIKVISTDGIRKAFPGIEEKNVWVKAYSVCADELRKGSDVIFDATSINPKVRQRLIDNIKLYYNDFSVGCYYFNTDKEICKKRVEKRNNIAGELYLPIEVIDQYAANIVKPTLDEDISFIKTIDENGEIIDEIYKI